MRAAPSRPLASPRTAARSSAATCSSRCRAPRRMGFHSRRRPPLAGAVAIVGEGRAPALPPGAMFVKVDNARRALSLIAARIYPRQPQVIAAVTGTSGKTSVAAFTRQIWQSLGYEAASVGTIGVVTPRREVYGSLTTPDPVDLHRTLAELAAEGITHLAIEASSHGLDQHRLDGIRVAAGGFTNLSRDHLDYHPSVEAYLEAKLRLFSSLVADGGSAVIDVDHEHSDAVVAAAKQRGLKLITVGRRGDGIRLLDVAIDGFTQAVTVEHAGKRHQFRLPLVGALPGGERAGRGGARHRDRRGGRSCVRCAGVAQGRQGTTRPGRRKRRCAGVCRLRAQAGRAGKGHRGAAALCEASSRRGVRRRRRPRQGQASIDGRDRGADGGPRHRHRRQSAQRESGTPFARPSSKARRARRTCGRSATAARRSATPSPGCNAAMCC